MKQVMRGMNLGGWLVLEPWITPSLFRNTGAEDEFGFCDGADVQRLKKLKQHHKTWIQREDFRWLAQHGYQAVRIPVGYWIFGDAKPYTGALSYLDSAMAWAEEFGLKVLICLHGAPGSQNGEMHSGHKGDVGWTDETKADDCAKQALQTIQRLAQRYAEHPSLLGIELLNEPSPLIPRRRLKKYYKQGYKVVRQECGKDIWVVFSDRFEPHRWQWQLHWPRRSGVVQDNHHYQIYTAADKALDVAGHIAKVRRFGWTLRLIGWHRKVIIGEWSAALDPQSLAGLDDKAKHEAYRQYTQAQIEAFKTADAWFYWTYRTEGGGPWSMRDTIQQDTSM